MKHKYIIYKGYIFLIALFSCSKSHQPSELLQESDENWRLKKTDQVNILIDSVTNPIIFKSKIQEVEGIPYLTFYNSNASSIEIYEANGFNHTKTVKFQQDGPNSIYSAVSHYLHNWDSIFVLDEIGDKLATIDSSGQIKHSVSLTTPDGKYKFTTDHVYVPFYNSEKKSIGLWMYEDISPDMPLFYQEAKNVEISVNTGDVIEEYGGFPEDYKRENIYFIYNTIHGYRSGDYVINHYSKSHYIEIYNYRDKSLFKRIYAKSAYLSKNMKPLIKMGEKVPDMAGMQEYIYTEGSYMSMFTNQDNSLHFRIVEHSKELNDDTDLEYRPFSIMVLDDNFKLLLEQKFDGDKYHLFDVFAIKNKLYVSINKVLNKKFLEDRLQYDVFEILQEN